MADLAARIPDLAAENRALLEAGAGILGDRLPAQGGHVAAVLLAADDLCRRGPPVAAIFAIMTKVGAYIVLRLWLLLFGEGAGASAQFGGEWLLFGGMATVAFGAIGTLASQDMARLAALLRARVVRHGARRHRHGAGRRHRRSAVLPGQLDARHQRVLPAGRARRTRARAGRGRARRHPGGLWRRRRRPRRGGRGRHRDPGHHGRARACASSAARW